MLVSIKGAFEDEGFRYVVSVLLVLKTHSYVLACRKLEGALRLQYFCSDYYFLLINTESYLIFICRSLASV